MFLFKRNGIYYLQYLDLNKKLKRLSTKKNNKSDALIFLSEFNKNLNKVVITKTIFLNSFKDEYVNHSKLSVTDSYINRSIEPAFRRLFSFTGNVELTKLDKRIMEKFILTVYNGHKSAAALYYRTLKAAFNKAVAWNYIKENPLSNVKIPKIPKSLPVFINDSELQIIIDVTNEKTLKDFFIVGFYTGMRLAELVNLKWNAINFKLNYITVKNTNSFTTKGKKERIIPMNKIVFNLLKEIIPKVINLNQDSFVFAKCKDVKLNENFISKKFKQAVRKSGLDEKIHFHTLRHSFASNLVQNGVSLYVIKELLGHEDLKTTQIYSHLQKQNLYDAVRMLERNLTIKENTAN